MCVSYELGAGCFLRGIGSILVVAHEDKGRLLLGRNSAQGTAHVGRECLSALSNSIFMYLVKLF